MKTISKRLENKNLVSFICFSFLIIDIKDKNNSNNNNNNNNNILFIMIKEIKPSCPGRRILWMSSPSLAFTLIALKG